MGDREMVYSLTLPDVGEAVWRVPASVHKGVPRAVVADAAPRDLWPWLALLGGIGLLADWLLYGRSRAFRLRASRAMADFTQWRKASDRWNRPHSMERVHDVRSHVGPGDRVASSRLDSVRMAAHGAQAGPGPQGRVLHGDPAGAGRAAHDSAGNQSRPGRAGGYFRQLLGRRSRARFATRADHVRSAGPSLDARRALCAVHTRSDSRRATEQSQTHVDFRRSRPRDRSRSRGSRGHRVASRRHGPAGRAHLGRQGEQGQHRASRLAGPATGHSHRYLRARRPCQTGSATGVRQSALHRVHRRTISDRRGGLVSLRGSGASRALGRRQAAGPDAGEPGSRRKSAASARQPEYAGRARYRGGDSRRRAGRSALRSGRGPAAAQGAVRNAGSCRAGFAFPGHARRRAVRCESRQRSGRRPPERLPAGDLQQLGSGGDPRQRQAGAGTVRPAGRRIAGDRRRAEHVQGGQERRRSSGSGVARQAGPAALARRHRRGADHRQVVVDGRAQDGAGARGGHRSGRKPAAHRSGGRADLRQFLRMGRADPARRG